MPTNDNRTPFHLTQKDDVKIFILHLLLNLGEPVDLVTFNDVAVQDSFVSQIDFMDCLCDLVAIGAIEEREENGKKTYRISHKGTVVAKTLESTLLPQIREKSVRSAMQILILMRRGSKAQSRVEDLPDGRARVVCTLSDAGGAYMEAALVFPTRHEATLVKYNFDDNPEFTYRGMLGLFSGDMNYLIPDTE